MAHTRRPRTANPSENGFVDLAMARGWEVLKRGWPDFLCVSGNSVMACEVKPGIFRGSDSAGRERLKYEQTVVMAALHRHGVPCFVSDGNEIAEFNLRAHGHGLLKKSIYMMDPRSPLWTPGAIPPASGAT